MSFCFHCYEGAAVSDELGEFPLKVRAFTPSGCTSMASDIPKRFVHIPLRTFDSKPAWRQNELQTSSSNTYLKLEKQRSGIHDSLNLLVEDIHMSKTVIFIEILFCRLNCWCWCFHHWVDINTVLSVLWFVFLVAAFITLKVHRFTRTENGSTHSSQNGNQEQTAHHCQELELKWHKKKNQQFNFYISDTTPTSLVSSCRTFSPPWNRSLHSGDLGFMIFTARQHLFYWFKRTWSSWVASFISTQ